MQKRMVEPVISDKVKAICQKLEQDRTGDTLTKSERSLEVSREEAAHILSARAPAGREIEPRRLAQYMRQDGRHKGRLVPYRATGNTYTYQVASLLNVRFGASRTTKKG